MSTNEPTTIVDDIFSPYLSSLGFVAPELEHVEDFHETTKYKPYFDRILGRRIGTYLTDPRAVQETVSNWKRYTELPRIYLPNPDPVVTPFSEIMARRRSCRSFTGQRITIDELSETLSSVRSNRKAKSSLDKDLELRFRPYPSGGGLYPCEIYMVASAVDGLKKGVYHYDPFGHALTLIAPMPSASQFQKDMSDLDGTTGNVAVTFFITALFERTVVKYAERGYRFAIAEAGMIGLMLNLAAVGIDLGTLNWGGYIEDKIDRILAIDGVSETVVGCLLIGKEE
jgi:SagB-type dehydrogenase family enzyme